MRFRSYIDGSRALHGRPRRSMEVQATLGSDIALVFDECTPFHVDRDYTARSTERTHRWLDRCLAWHAEHGPARPARLRHRPGRRLRGPARESAQAVAGRRRRRDRDRRLARRRQGADVRGRRLDDRGAARRRRPRHLLGIGEIDDLIARRRARHRHLRLRDADAPRPPRHGARARPRDALARRPAQAPRWRDGRGAAHGGLPVPGLRAATPAATCATSRARADRRAAADAAQPRLRRSARSPRRATRSRRGALRRATAAARPAAAPRPGSRWLSRAPLLGVLLAR